MGDFCSHSEGRFLRLWFSSTCFGLVSPEKCSQTNEGRACLLFAYQLVRISWNEWTFFFF